MAASPKSNAHRMPARCDRCDHFQNMDSYETQRDKAVDHLLIWNLRGKTIGSSGDEAFSAQPGDLIVLPRGLSQRYRPRPDRRWEWMWVHLDGPLADEVVGQLRSAANGPVCRVGLGQLVRHHFEAVLLHGPRNASSKIDADQRLAAGASLTALLAVLRRAAEHPTASQQPWDISAVSAYIASHLHEPIRAEDLAAVAGVSLPHFNRLFRQHFDASPMRYVTQRRCDRAMSLLGETSLPIQRIAEMLGYDDGFYFSRVFKQTTGLAPRHYRNATQASRSS